MDIGPIPWTAAKEYAVFYDIDKDEFSRMWTLLCRMDSVYINHKAKKTPPGPTPPSANGETTAPAMGGARR